MASDFRFYAVRDEPDSNSRVNDSSLLAIWGEYVKDWRYKLVLVDHNLEDLYYDKIYTPANGMVNSWLNDCQAGSIEVGSTGHNCKTVDKINGRFGYKKLMLKPKLAKHILSFYDESEVAFTNGVYRLCTKMELKLFLWCNLGNWIYGRSE